MNVVQNNLISIVILLILFLGMVRQVNKKDDLYRLFLILILMTIFMHILEVAMYLFMGGDSTLANIGLRGLAVLYHAIIPVILTMVFVFFDQHFHPKGRHMVVYLIPLFILFVINLIFSVLSLTKGYLFIVTEDNNYTVGSMYQIYEILIYTVFLMTYLYAVIQRKKISKQTFMQLTLFMLPLTISIVLTLTFDFVYMTWHSFMASLLIMYVMMQFQITATDYLTGLKNRRGYENALFRLEKNKMEEKIIGIMIDIDNFKRINDSYGHAMGDEVLIAVGDILKKVVRRNDFVSRTGGDEFAIIMQSSEIDIKLKVVKRIKEQLRLLNEEKHFEFPICISIGCDVYNKEKFTSMRKFFEHLDQKMYHHKRMSNGSAT